MKAVLLAVACVVAVPLVGCDSKPPSTAPAAKPGPTHTVRGKVEGLPVKDKPSTSFMVHHEAIAEWLRPDGTKGMNSMTMPFPLADGVSLDGITIGDIVELTVIQYLGDKVPYRVSSIRKLPADTTLNFGKVGG